MKAFDQHYNISSSWGDITSTKWNDILIGIKYKPTR